MHGTTDDFEGRRRTRSSTGALSAAPTTPTSPVPSAKRARTSVPPNTPTSSGRRGRGTPKKSLIVEEEEEVAKEGESPVAAKEENNVAAKPEVYRNEVEWFEIVDYPFDGNLRMKLILVRKLPINKNLFS